MVMSLISIYRSSLVTQQQPFGSKLKGLFHHLTDRKHHVFFDRNVRRANRTRAHCKIIFKLTFWNSILRKETVQFSPHMFGTKLFNVNPIHI